jgi:hypothetical protein
MWHMEEGDRAMTASEWGIFQLGLAELVAHIEEDLIYETDAAETGVRVFDRLTVEQKLALLADVADALHDPDVPMMDLTAANEGAVAAVFVVTSTLLREEITENRDTTMRSLLLANANEQESDRSDSTDLPRLKSRKWGDWDLLMECLEGAIFWDNDWAAGDHYLDMPPEEAKTRMEYMGIDPDYFLAIPREPSPTELSAARQKLANLTATDT